MACKSYVETRVLDGFFLEKQQLLLGKVDRW